MKKEVLAKGRLPADATAYDIKNNHIVKNPKRDQVEVQVSKRIQLIMDRTSQSKPVAALNERIAELKKALLNATDDQQNQLIEEIQKLKDEVMTIIKREMKQNYPFGERKGQKYKKWNRLTNEAFHIRERLD